ncbi:VOC family protein [Pendulispora albinea]|uniref:VOC family protein n=1 Tax=Pendulispora albinea TaxID=2741071 RepID=A0ABZ2M7W1_9BACT
MQINGIAHIQLSVSDLPRSREFYRKLFAFFEMSIVFDDATTFYGVGGKTGIVITRADPALGPFNQRHVGLHHVCFRLRSREDIDQLHAFLVDIGAPIVHAPEDGPWAKGYYSVLFEDPDGIRLEANYVPGKGNLDPDVKLPLGVP